MKQLLAAVCLFAVLPAQGQGAVKAPKGSGNARLTFRGKMTGETVALTLDGRSFNLVGVELGKGQTAYVQTTQDFSRRAFERVQKRIAVIQDEQKALTEAIKKYKGEDLKKALDAIRRNSEARKKALEEDAVVVTGVVTRVGEITTGGPGLRLKLGDRRTLLVVGQVRDAGPGVKPAPPENGQVVLEGEMKPGKVDLGKEGSAPFSIQNGPVPIAVAGKRAEVYATAKGFVRVTGRLRVGDKGVVIIDAEKLEAGSR